MAVLLVTGLAGILWALRLWRRLAAPLAGLVEQARALDAPVAAGLPSTIAEIELLRRALMDAAHQQRQRRQAEADLQRAEQRLRVVVEASPSGLLMVDARGRIVMVNQRIEAYFQRSRDELIGQPLDRLLPEARRAGHAGRVADFLTAPMARTMGTRRDLYGLRRDGSQFPIEVGLVPVDFGGERFVLASVLDVTERQRTEDELRRSNHDLEQFAYVASHDLQEPLRMVANFTALLGERYSGRLDAKADRYIHYAVDGAKRMQALILDLLAYARVGSQPTEPAPVAVDTAVTQAMANLQHPIAAAGARVEVKALPVVRADLQQLTQVFQNLIGNAIKFRGSQAPHVVVDATWADGLWRFTVSDNGIGFDPRHAERIFLMYQRLHAQGQYAGSGIGLAIVRRIVERHGGRAGAESQPGAGATFWFTLPAEAPPPPQAAEPAAAAGPTRAPP
jgi:PAS domain S-box-containing protein